MEDDFKKCLRYLRCLGFALTLVTPGLATAQTVGDLSRIQGETLLLRVRIDRETAQAELDARLRVSGGVSASDSFSTSASDTIPTVKSVYGANGLLLATVMYSNGTELEVKVGDVVVGGYTVKTIEIDRVEFAKGKETIRLVFSAKPPIEKIESATVPLAPVPSISLQPSRR
jgi:type IV pilus biogenesis protein PilP